METQGKIKRESTHRRELGAVMQTTFIDIYGDNINVTRITTVTDGRSHEGTDIHFYQLCIPPFIDFCSFSYRFLIIA